MKSKDLGKIVVSRLSAPNPVPGEFIRAYSVTAYEIKLTWKPPSTGYYVGFRVEYEDQNEERFVHNM